MICERWSLHWHPAGAAASGGSFLKRPAAPLPTHSSSSTQRGAGSSQGLTLLRMAWDRWRWSSKTEQHCIGVRMDVLRLVLCFCLYMACIDSTAQDNRKEVEREGEWHAAKGPRLGVELGAIAARTKPLFMGCLLYQLSKVVPWGYISLTEQPAGHTWLSTCR